MSQMSRLKRPTIPALILSFLVCSLLLILGIRSTKTQIQRPITLTVQTGHEKEEIDHIYKSTSSPHDTLNEIPVTNDTCRLKEAEIIPTIIDDFKPTLRLTITWNLYRENAIEANYGNTIPTSETKQAPAIEFLNVDRLPIRPFPQTPQLTVAMTDPDAPSRDDPENSEFCHWIVTTAPRWVSNSEGMADRDMLAGRVEVMQYTPPDPPERTGKHRYVFIVLAPLNRTAETLYLRAPPGRKRWGFDREGLGFKEWAKEMGLGVVGANFIYAQNEAQ